VPHDGVSFEDRYVEMAKLTFGQLDELLAT
jgi:hypothetical protein